MNKPKLTIVSDPNEIRVLLDNTGHLGVPVIIPSKVFGEYYADADDLRAWRASQPDIPGDQK